MHYPALVIIIPLLTALITAIFGWTAKRLCFPVVFAGLVMACGTSLGLLSRVIDQGTVLYKLGGWTPPWGIAYKVDFINSIILLAVFIVALINLFPARKIVETHIPEKSAAFYTLYLLFITGLSGILMTGDAFNLYVLLEISSLTGYALIALGDKRAVLSALNYLFMGTIGASFYLLGVGFLYMMTGSLNMEDLASLLPTLYESRVVLIAFVFCMTGVFVKMALFPLHGWLPNAYSGTSTAVAALIAPLTTKVMIYVMIRISLSVFTPVFCFDTSHIGDFIVGMAVIAIIAGSLLALRQTNIRRMLAYIIVVEVGYMVGGFWLGHPLGVTGAVLHIVNDALMTLCVFLAAGSILYVKPSDSFADIRGLFREMPLTMSAFVVGALSIIGVPPTCGFFSKWYLISGGIASGHTGYVVVLILSSLTNAILFFRIFEICYFEPFTDHHGGGHRTAITESPPTLVIPLAIAALLVVVVGIYSGDIAQQIMKAIAVTAV